MSNYKDGRTLKKYYCVDCGKELSDYTAKRCNSCNSKLMWQNPKFREKYEGKNNPSYKDGRTLRKYYCIDCGKELSNYTAKRCKSCDTKKQWRNIKYREKNIESSILTQNKFEIKEKYRKASEKNWQNPKYRERTIKAMNTFECKEKNSKRCKKQWEDGKMDDAFISPTKPEKEMMKILERLKIDHIFQFRPENFSMVYDFYIPNMNLLIEFDGIYWHSLKEVKLRDIEKTKYARDDGYNLLRFDETNLDNFENVILETIKKEENYAIGYV